ncbi:uncharacterized protein LOC107266341 [Cephus cinctus]|uniref:Uncharacterized protein LOC107266341 n=1 Tax=Cephus cinctus TaxID=211228 RepID=A0AAJ7FHL2_CEPCN|nr:uncharacterized protein LOC107266341 [Cephus cinctus]
MCQIWKIFLVGVFVGSSQGQFDFGSDWTGGLFHDINGFGTKINDDISNLNQQIQQDVQKQINDVNKEILDEIAKAQKDGTMTSSGQSVSVSNINGRQRTFISGHTKSGQLYYRETEEQVINNILHHTDRVYDKNKKIIRETSYTLDLSNPNAKPVPVNSKSD